MYLAYLNNTAESMSESSIKNCILHSALVVAAAARFFTSRWVFGCAEESLLKKERNFPHKRAHVGGAEKLLKTDFRNQLVQKLGDENPRVPHHHRVKADFFCSETPKREKLCIEKLICWWFYEPQDEEQRFFGVKGKFMQREIILFL